MVGDDVDGNTAVQQLRKNVRRVAHQAHRKGALVGLGGENQVESFVEVRNNLVEVALALAALHTGPVDVDDEARAAVECD